VTEASFFTVGGVEHVAVLSADMRLAGLQPAIAMKIVTDLFDREAAHIRSQTCETILTDVRLCDSLREKLTPRAFDGADGGGGGVSAGAAVDLNVNPPAELDDLWTCWIDFDADGKRRKPWRKVLSEGSVEVYRDSPVTGEAQALFCAKHVFLNGGRPSGWLREWARDRGITKTHRVFHEVQTLVTALEAAGETDQVNLGGLVCIEIVVRRLQSLVEAYSRGPENPDWTLAASLTSASDVGDVISKNLRSSAMRETKERMDIENFRARSLANSSRGYTDPLAVDHTGEATGGGSAPYLSPAPSDRSRGRGSRGRGARTGGGGR
jgi:hypothetical protein